MTYTLDVSEKLDRLFAKLSKRDKLQFEILTRKINEILEKEYDENMNLEQIEFELYNIPRKPEMTESEKKQAQRQFFKIVYMSLFGREIGPRLPTFVWASDKSNLLKLLR